MDGVGNVVDNVYQFDYTDERFDENPDWHLKETGENSIKSFKMALIIESIPARKEAINNLSLKALSNDKTVDLYTKLMTTASMKVAIDAWVISANTEKAFDIIDKITTKKISATLDEVVNKEVGAKQRLVIDYLKFTMAQATDYLEYKPYRMFKNG